MAVATHVSRVAKDYAPFGYSVMESSATSVVMVGGADGVNYYFPLFDADDCDIRLEALSRVEVSGLASSGSNYWTFTLVSAPAGIGSETAISSTSIGGATTGVAANTKTDFVITVPVVAKGNAVYMKCAATGSAPAFASGVTLRIRRQA